jgi:Peptidase A4 family
MKHSSLTFALMLLLSAPIAGNAQPQHPHQIPTNLPGVTAFEAVPVGFDATSASDDELAEWGYPPRPEQDASPAEYAHWLKVTATMKNRIFPKLQQTNIYHGPARATAAGNSIEESTLSSYLWSGYAAFSGAKSYGSSSFYSVSSDVVVPVARQAFNACTGEWDYGASWVGLDGWNSDDVLQDGVEFDAICSGGITGTYYSAWYEWYPDAEVRILNFPVTPGDDLFMTVWQVTANQGVALIINYNTGETVEVGFTAPAGTKLIGNSAEWVTERPQLTSGVPALTNYISEMFWNAEALTEKKKKFYPSTSSTKEIQMLDLNQKKISVPSRLGNQIFDVKDEGSAYDTLE